MCLRITSSASFVWKNKHQNEIFQVSCYFDQVKRMATSPVHTKKKRERHVNQVECRRSWYQKWDSSLHSDLAWLPGMQLASTQSLPIHGGTAAVDICSPPKEEDINQAHLEQVSRWMAFGPLTVCPRLVVFSLARQISSSPVWPKLFSLPLYNHPWRTEGIKTWREQYCSAVTSLLWQ